jgi:hypothetical protein
VDKGKQPERLARAATRDDTPTTNELFFALGSLKAPEAFIHPDDTSYSSGPSAGTAEQHQNVQSPRVQAKATAVMEVAAKGLGAAPRPPKPMLNAELLANGRDDRADETASSEKWVMEIPISTSPVPGVEPQGSPQMSGDETAGTPARVSPTVIAAEVELMRLERSSGELPGDGEDTVLVSDRIPEQLRTVAEVDLHPEVQAPPAPSAPKEGNDTVGMSRYGMSIEMDDLSLGVAQNGALPMKLDGETENGRRENSNQAEGVYGVTKKDD